MEDSFCWECNRSTVVVFDHSTGDTICTECSLVLEARSVDQTAEWRIFGDESGDNDRVRIGSRVNPLLADGDLSTFISRPNGGQPESKSNPSVARWQSRASNPDHNLIVAFETIAGMADRLDLISPIKDRAMEIYKKIQDSKLFKSKKQNAVLAACLYIACRQEGKPRTMKEICTVCNGATKKEVARVKELIVKQPGVEMEEPLVMRAIQAGDVLRRFCSHLGMAQQAIKAAQEAVQKSQELDIRRNPISIAAAIIYMISQLSGDKKAIRDISLVSGVAETTIRNSYKDLHSYASRIIPSSFAKEKDLKNLCVP